MDDDAIQVRRIILAELGLGDRKKTLITLVEELEKEDWVAIALGEYQYRHQ